MLKYRILTAIVLIPLFVLFLLKSSPGWFSLVTAAILILGAWEWSFFMGVKRFLFTLFYPIIIGCILFLSIFLYMPNVMIAALIWWLFAFLLVVLYPKGSQGWGNGIVARGLMGVMVLVPCWMAINFIRNIYGVYALLFLFVLIWGADTGAYFAGKLWGKHKLAPAVSPGKTWQGLLGALFITIPITGIALWWSDASYPIWWGVSIIAVITVLFSVLGDLFESMLKRKENLKDSGHILPGHGGILDRIDSLTAAAPIFLLGVWLLQRMLP